MPLPMLPSDRARIAVELGVSHHLVDALAHQHRRELGVFDYDVALVLRVIVRQHQFQVARQRRSQR